MPAPVGQQCVVRCSCFPTAAVRMCRTAQRQLRLQLECFVSPACAQPQLWIGSNLNYGVTMAVAATCTAGYMLLLAKQCLGENTAASFMSSCMHDPASIAQGL
jgi:hypothetical protein